MSPRLPWRASTRSSSSSSSNILPCMRKQVRCVHMRRPVGKMDADAEQQLPRRPNGCSTPYLQWVPALIHRGSGFSAQWSSGAAAAAAARCKGLRQAKGARMLGRQQRAQLVLPHSPALSWRHSGPPRAAAAHRILAHTAPAHAIAFQTAHSACQMAHSACHRMPDRIQRMPDGTPAHARWHTSACQMAHSACQRMPDRTQRMLGGTRRT